MANVKKVVDPSANTAKNIRMSYVVRVKIIQKVSPEKREIVAGFLVRIAEQFGFEGMEDWSVDLKRGEKILALEREFHDLSGRREVNQHFILYFRLLGRARRFAERVGALLEGIEISAPTKAKTVDWVSQWKRFYHPQKIVANQHSPIIWVLPEWKKRKLSRGQLAIRIRPGQAFGTGTHPTTQLCLELFAGAAFKTWNHHKSISVLDFGAGTAILAIAALAWGREYRREVNATCIEIDPVALDLARENLALNRVKARLKPQGIKGKYDLVFANVLSPALMANKRALWNAVKPGGVLILSGILASEACDFFARFSKATRTAQSSLRVQGDWAAVFLQKA